VQLKDEALARAASQANVAQFASFAPVTLELRHSAIIGLDGRVHPHAAITQLLLQSSTRTVNVRSFKPGQDRGNPFFMGLSTVDQVLRRLGELASAHYYTIVNENIDINDGGVSGVRWNDWTEFAPKDTPRCVEKPGTAGLPSGQAETLFNLVYKTGTPLQTLHSGFRVEFSLHPSPVGYRRERSVLWEVSEEPSDQKFPDRNIDWPNSFSEFIGDKAYGLLIAEILGFRVPHTQVICRGVQPFEFGRDTRYDALWTRTCPRRFSPGLFPTEPRYVDVFNLLKDCDPTGDTIGSVLIQQGVRPRFSGAVAFSGGGPPLVSGVRGQGSDFMLGGVQEEVLPKSTYAEVLRTYDTLTEALGGPCRFEWVRDDRTLWMVQLNRDRSGGFDVSEGEAESWVTFDPSDGVDALRDLIAEIEGTSVGVELTRRVGLTSHIGDLLRLARVPARVPGALQQPELW
jgi:hypothetical protein